MFGVINDDVGAYCEYLGSSGGYGSSGGVPEVRESGIWKFGGGTEVRESSFF